VTVLTKQALKTLCDTADREKQMLQLDAWGIAYELTLAGNLKVLDRDLKWSAENSLQGEPKYGAA